MLTTAVRGVMVASMPNSVTTTRRNTEETEPGAMLTSIAGVSFDILRLPYADRADSGPVYAQGRAAGRLSAEDAAELLRATRALLALPVEAFDVRDISVTMSYGDL